VTDELLALASSLAVQAGIMVRDGRAAAGIATADTKSSSTDVVTEFDRRLAQAKLALNEQGLTVALYDENPDPKAYVSVVPTSAVTGEGVPDLLATIVNLTQTMMAARLTYVDDTQCTVLEVKVGERGAERRRESAARRPHTRPPPFSLPLSSPIGHRGPGHHRGRRPHQRHPRPLHRLRERQGRPPPS
jgi:hypothetical protein